LDKAGLRELASSFWPAIGAIDAARDRFELAQLRETGARAIVSGQGGDGVFFQYPTAMVAADEFRRRGWAMLSSPLLADVARRTRQSVWAVLRQVHAARRGAERRPTMTSTLISRDLRATAESTAHAWVLEARARSLTPGKILHIQGMATAHLYRGPARRFQDADLILPLVAQPVAELCLSIPTPDLANAAYDRPFARQAFADRLPDIVVQRRAKGEQTAYFAKLVANSLETLRPFLLEGTLCEAGLLDRAALDQTLNPQQLIAGGGGAPSDVLIAASVEAWVRHWQGRVPDLATAGRGR
jgi:asparagine synthase (glutamine-hydrolysing)